MFPLPYIGIIQQGILAVISNDYCVLLSYPFVQIQSANGYCSFDPLGINDTLPVISYCSFDGSIYPFLNQFRIASGHCSYKVEEHPFIQIQSANGYCSFDPLGIDDSLPPISYCSFDSAAYPFLNQALLANGYSSF